MVVPADMPVTTPVVAMVPTAVVPDDHVPPVVVVASVVVAPVHTCNVPVMAAGAAETVTVLVEKQPVGSVYEMDDVPLVMPVTTPVTFMVPTDGLLLLHVPPAVVHASVIVAAGQTLAAPVMAAGSAFIVTIAVAVPNDDIYDTTAVPAVMPVTTPVPLLTVTLPDALLHVPPGAVLLNVVVCPIHTFNVPVMGGISDTELHGDIFLIT
jgi:hypothetical protein